MHPLERNGWKIYFHPTFAAQRLAFRENVNKLKSNLTTEKYQSHPDVKHFANLMRAIKETIPDNPLASEYVLKNNLKSYSRLKGRGVPDRSRLFFKVDNQEKSIVILWLGFPRKEGSKSDCYVVFAQMVSRNEFPSDIKQLISMCGKTE